MMKHNARAYALPLVLVVLSIVALSVASLAYALEAATAEAGRIVGDIRGRAGCDAMLGIATAVVQDTLRTKPSTPPSALIDAVCAEATTCSTNGFHRRVPGGIAPPGMALDDFSIHYANSGTLNALRPIATGGLAGVVAEERLLSVYVRGHDTRSGRECVGQEDLTLASLSPLQLNVMVVPEAKLTPPTTLELDRLHNNRSLALANVDATHHSDERDARLGPAVVTPAMQAPNTNTDDALHWLIDPATSEDSDEVRQVRLAHVADLRIIDGVWYVRDDALLWPGRAIWSDHPGKDVGHKDAAARLVQSGAGIGQRDIYASGALPTGYSLYEADDDGDLTDTNGGVISYGGIAATANGPAPAAYPSYASHTATQDVCGGEGGFTTIDACTSARPTALLDGARTGFEHGGQNILPINFNIEAFAAALKNNAPRELGSYFPATRPFNGIVWITQTWKDADKGLKHGDGTGGFNLPTPQGTGPQPTTLTTPVLTCGTKDVGNAAAETIDGEDEGGPTPVPVPGGGPVGGGGGGHGGGGHGHGNGVPLPAFPHGTGPCPAVPDASVQPRAQVSPPRTVCGGDSAADGSVKNSQFAVVSCNDPVWGPSKAEGAQPNALRIIRGAAIDQAAFPGGLTIATNLPLYIHGDVNSAPMAAARRKVLFAADRITLLSNQFSDNTRPWNTSRALGQAGNISVLASLITGVPDGNTNLDQALRAAESWRTRHALVVGSIVVGFKSVHDTGSGAVVGFSTGLNLVADPHLANPLVQPPGTPRVIAGVTGHWRR